MIADIDLSAIQDEAIRKQIRQLLNLIEKQAESLRKLQEENQALRDEINHFKGEQGKPNVKASKMPSAETSKHSSETERKKKRDRHQSGKKASSRSAAKRWSRFRPKNCQLTRSSKAMWMWWCKTSW
jgi:regulator of replication initiation timing